MDGRKEGRGEGRVGRIAESHEKRKTRLVKQSS